jgi:hypothetical protein
MNSEKNNNIDNYENVLQKLKNLNISSEDYININNIKNIEYVGTCKLYNGPSKKLWNVDYNKKNYKKIMVGFILLFQIMKLKK